MKTQTRGTGCAPRNSVLGIAQVRKGIDNAQGNDSDMACSTRVGYDCNHSHDALHGKTQTGQSLLQVFGKPSQIMDRRFDNGRVSRGSDSN
jgi:hypothetical protein